MKNFNNPNSPSKKSDKKYSYRQQTPEMSTAYNSITPYATQQGINMMPSAAPSYSSFGAMPSTSMMPSGAPAQQPATTLNNINYTPGYLKTQIGRYVKVEFLIGTNLLIDREGTLIAVGTSYIILQEPETDDLVLCDMYSIKFVKIFY